MMEYTTALYIRLSDEDDNAGESNSVINQRDLLTRFAAAHPDISKGKILQFVDDGWSGTNFERPALKQMLDAVRKGEIRCIAVKDFSRFGREYIEVCEYLEQIFPFLGVRFISVNDHYDSNAHKGSTAGLEVGFKALIHSLYSKDLSVRVRQGKRQKAEKGECFSRLAPFGYQKSKADKHKLEIDESAATVVRRVFELALDGLCFAEIARTLNQEGHDTPFMYRKKRGERVDPMWMAANDKNYWVYTNVNRILRDKRYTGKMIGFKRKRTKVGINHTEWLPEKDWIVVDNALDAIITEETYQAVQMLLPEGKTRPPVSKGRNPLAGLIKCGHCGHAPDYCNAKRPYYVCRFNSVSRSDVCFSGRVYVDNIKNIILDTVRQQARLSLDMREQSARKLKQDRQARESSVVTLGWLHSRLKEIDRKKLMLFEDFSESKITREQYTTAKDAYSREMDGIKARITQLENDIGGVFIPKSDMTVSDTLKKLADAEAFDDDMLSLIERVIIYAPEHLEVQLAFGDIFL